MGQLFDINSPVMHFLNRFASLVVLNFLFLFTSIPIFTIGTSLTALYDVVFRLDTEREGKVVPTYFRAFRANFKQSTSIWLIFLLLITASCANAVIFSNMDTQVGTVLSVISLVILVNSMLALGFVFPLLSQFDNTLRNTLKNSLLLCIAHLPRALAIAAINCFPWALMLMNLYAFIRFGFLWFAIYFAAAAYWSSRLLLKVFQPLMEQASK